MKNKVAGKRGYGNKRQHAFVDSARDAAKGTLRALDVRPSKQRGQNFVVNELVISSILDFGSPRSDETLLEIGPGLGALTSALIPYGLKTVLEIEPAFAEDLRSKFPDLNVIQTDARTFDYASLGNPVTIFANLPYSISSEMIIALSAAGPTIVNRIVLMLQKEFAQRLCSPVGGKDYGIMSVYCQRAAVARLGPIVSAENFHPRPKIDSQLIELRFRKESVGLGANADQSIFRKVVRAAFSKRRKKIVNSLMASGIAPEENIREALSHANVSADIRPQELSYLDYERLAEAISL